MGPHSSLCALIFLHYAIFATAQGPRNFSIDDTQGDEQNHIPPHYSPDLTEWDPHDCGYCAVKPDATKAGNGTWTAMSLNLTSTPEMSIAFDFKGTAVYIFFILPNNIPNHPMSTICDFSVDRQFQFRFTHETSHSGDRILYNQLVFFKENLSDQEHTIRINASSPQAYINFDYALYTDPGPWPLATDNSPTQRSGGPNDVPSQLNSLSASANPLTTTSTTFDPSVVLLQLNGEPKF